MRRERGLIGGTLPQGKPALRIPGSNIYAIPLTGRYGRGRYALIDAEFNVPEIVRFAWHVGGKGKRYVISRKGARFSGLHQMVMWIAGEMPPTPKHMIDHVNGNPFNNTRENLRWLTNAENSMRRHRLNTSRNRFKGITFHKQSRRWVAQIKRDCKRIHIGMYGTDLEAARAYDSAAREIFGEFALTNEDLGLLTLPEGACR